MVRWVKWISRLFSRSDDDAGFDAEKLRHAFKTRYQSFKRLLKANNQALEIMAEIERTLSGSRPFGMTFIRSRCTRISTLVFQIVKHINDLAPGKYTRLFDMFKSIQGEIQPHLHAATISWDGPLVLSLDEIDRDRTDWVGQKMVGLAEIQNRFDLNIPGGFVITAAAYRRFMQHDGLQLEINRRLQAADATRKNELFDLSTSIHRLILESEIPEDLEREIKDMSTRLWPDTKANLKVAMRSSALGEDSVGASFAGQYRTMLNVDRNDILYAYKVIVASKYGLAAMTYRLNRGIVDEEVAMCVGCLEMVDAESGGVIYSRNPININDDSILINSAWGLPKTVVDGRVNADLFVFDRGNPLKLVRMDIAEKDKKFLCNTEEEGALRVSLTGEERTLASLSESHAQELARIALRLEEYYGSPRDIEWALDRAGKIYLLQCRRLYAGNPTELPANIREESTLPGTVKLSGGLTASSGAAAGPVFKVRKYMDSLRFPQGAVLVVQQALPAWASLLGNAAAVISEKGGVTGHLANVAREFNIPALFGIEGAMESLNDEETVTVDADSKHVFEGYIESLVGEKRHTRNLMEGSPVYDVLKAVGDNIIPLNLLDPDSSEFRPSNCKTLHDITRFCHEKAVSEMFSFGKDHHFPERSSKQLYCDAPMQWWILNLDDGFKEEVDGKYIRLDNIASIPMLALWEGVVAIPWEGPPAIDGRGLMSVMFEATKNTDLALGSRSQYAVRNYFMISKNYCSLSSRLGFHFSTIEALVSERRRENYISFRFKGGAATLERRLKRIHFIKDLLEANGFRVEVIEDNLRARVENRSLEYMCDRLKILGYLTIHTRQLDMIMSKPARVEHFRTKMEKDIRLLLEK